jgi:hypothetical protein
MVFTDDHHNHASIFSPALPPGTYETRKVNSVNSWMHAKIMVGMVWRSTIEVYTVPMSEPVG